MNVLDRIVVRVRERLDETRRSRPLAMIRREGEQSSPRASFREALRAPGISLIAEAKQASPSKGILRAPYDAAGLARLYEVAGARAISVLTEPEFFRGSEADLRAVAGATRLPILRKDFVVAEDQLWEARAWGASAALLIVAVLEDSHLADLLHIASGASLDALVEVHTETELERALRAGASIVGVNNRDLTTFVTDLGTTGRLARGRAPGMVLVAESGIGSRADVLTVERAGADAMLVGEAILVASDPARKIAELLGTDEGGSRS